MLILPEWLQDQNTGLLLVTLLLTLWLWMLVRRRDEDPVAEARPTPMSADELGRFVFMAARSEDLSRYRGLFLNGSEAHEVLNNFAHSYLEHRSYNVLKRSLTDLTRRLPSQAIYVGLGEQKGRMFTIKVKNHSGELHTIKIGTVTQLGPVWRLLEPVMPR